MRPAKPKMDSALHEPEAGLSPAPPAEAEPAADFEAAAVRLSSSGRTLIVGHDARTVEACGRQLADRQPCLLFVEETAPAVTEKETGPVVRGRHLRIGGGLGGFRATAAVGGKHIRLSRLLEGSPACFDLVLDLRATATGDHGPLPAGYYLPGDDEDALARVLDELPLMIGVFEKPEFVRLEKTRCAHVGAEPEACARCLKACPVNALRGVGGSIQIDHAACVGCGLCATVCPTGAMHCLHYPPQDLLVAVHGRLSEARTGRQTASAVAFHQGRTDGIDRNPDAENHELRIPVAEIGCVGPEVWLGALAYGAARVILRLPESYPDRLAAVLAGERKWAAALLAKLGWSADRIQFETEGGSDPPPAARTAAIDPPAEFPPFQSKRALVRSSVAHLALNSGCSVDSLPLREGAPYGHVTVDSSACTLCMACAGACPVSALTPAGNVPSLSLIESRCIQCGRCRQICPERAVTLEARITLKPRRAELPRQLHASMPLACISCGKPFAAPALVEKMIARLKGHWMYTGEKENRRLRMCRDCRIRDFFQDREEDRSHGI
jgi:ferredoxin